jgi:predicted DNA-binding ribbon-helix-helix protein
MIRHITLDNTKTTLNLEPDYWQEIDRLATETGTDWKQWTVEKLKSQSGQQGKSRSAQLRLTVLNTLRGSHDKR